MLNETANRVVIWYFNRQKCPKFVYFSIRLINTDTFYISVKCQIFIEDHETGHCLQPARGSRPVRGLDRVKYYKLLYA